METVLEFSRIGVARAEDKTSPKISGWARTQGFCFAERSSVFLPLPRANRFARMLPNPGRGARRSTGRSEAFISRIGEGLAPGSICPRPESPAKSAGETEADQFCLRTDLRRRTNAPVIGFEQPTELRHGRAERSASTTAAVPTTAATCPSASKGVELETQLCSARDHCRHRSLETGVFNERQFPAAQR